MTTPDTAQEHYAKLLSRHPESLASFTAFSKTFKFTGYQLCRTLAPLFLDAATYAAATSAAATLFRGLLALARTPSPGLARDLARRPRWKDLLPGALARPSLLGGRVDMLLTASGFQVLEFNPFTPSVFPFGIECSEPLTSAFTESAVMRELSSTFAYRPVPVRYKLFDTLVHVHRERGGQGLPKLAIIDVPYREHGEPAVADPDIQYPDPHTLDLFGYLYGRGLEMQLCDVSMLTYENGELRANDTRIDLAFISGDHDYFDSCADDDVLFRAIREGAVGMGCGYPLGNVIDDKGLLADLSDPSVTSTFEPAFAEELAKIVPWTRRVEDATTTFEGRKVALMDFIRHHRESLVLKPAFGFGGKGVFLGWNMSQADWEQKLETLPDRYIVQTRANGKRVTMPYLDGDTPTSGDLAFDFSPFVWADGQSDGCIVRLSTNDVMNITQGATMAPVLVLDDQNASPTVR